MSTDFKEDERRVIHEEEDELNTNNKEEIERVKDEVEKAKDNSLIRCSIKTIK
jgi:hypothetical protein